MPLYVVLNPVRAGILKQPEDWKWSSYHATAGKEKSHPCLSTEWVLGQFSAKRDRAEKEYQKFVQRGIGKESIWTEVKGQTMLGEDEFVDGLDNYLKRHKHVAEIPKSQRFANRPALEKIFHESILRDRQDRDRTMAEAVEKYGYRQGEIARHLGMHYSTISNILRRKT